MRLVSKPLVRHSSLFDGLSHSDSPPLSGDVLVVPESWGHGVLNIEDSIAVATESKGSMWRATARLQALRHLPDDNRKKAKKVDRSVNSKRGEPSGAEEIAE